MAPRLSQLIPTRLSQATAQLRQTWQAGNWQIHWRSPNWRLGIGISLSISGAIGIWGISQLVLLPDLPNCWVVGFANAPAATKLYCGDQLSHRQTPEDLAHAINLVNSIGADDPVRSEGDRQIAKWSKELLQLAEKEYQAGHLNRAISIAYKVPNELPLYAQVEKQVSQWRATWKKAEEIYEKADQFISQQKWYEALTTAKKLLFLDNQYWQGEQYDQLVKKLQAERETYDWAEGKTDKPPSAGNALDQFFSNLKSKRNRESAQALDRAETLADDGDIAALQAAIDEAERVAFGSSNYDKAQDRIEAWQDQIERKQDAPRLQAAKKLARQGDPESLQQAIDTANDIEAGRELSDEADNLADELRDRLEGLERDRREQRLEQLTNSNNSLLTPVPATTVEIPSGDSSSGTPNNPSAVTAPSNAIPDNRTPENRTPGDNAPRDNAPRDNAPRDNAPAGMTLDQIVPEVVTPPVTPAETSGDSPAIAVPAGRSE